MYRVAILGKEHSSHHLVGLAHHVLAIDGWMPVYVELIESHYSNTSENIFNILIECDAVVVDDASGNIVIACKTFINYIRKRQKPLLKIVEHDLTFGSLELHDKIEQFLENVAKHLEENESAV